MATVTGVTAERAQEIEDASVVSGSLSGNDLILETHGGTQINVGRIIPPAVNNWPVGSIFLSVDPANPATLLGGGTWVRWGQGRVPIGVDETDADYDVVEETGGSKTHRLKVNEMPSHQHTINDHSHGMSHGHTAGSGGAGYAFPKYPPTRNVAKGPSPLEAVAGLPETMDHSHGISVNNFNGNTAGSGALTSNAAGGGDAVNGGLAHPIVQPFITCYMWKRTA